MVKKYLHIFTGFVTALVFLFTTSGARLYIHLCTMENKARISLMQNVNYCQSHSCSEAAYEHNCCNKENPIGSKIGKAACCITHSMQIPSLGNFVPCYVKGLKQQLPLDENTILPKYSFHSLNIKLVNWTEDTGPPQLSTPNESIYRTRQILC